MSPCPKHRKKKETEEKKRRDRNKPRPPNLDLSPYGWPWANLKSFDIETVGTTLESA